MRSQPIQSAKLAISLIQPLFKRVMSSAELSACKTTPTSWTLTVTGANHTVLMNCLSSDTSETHRLPDTTNDPYGMEIKVDDDVMRLMLTRTDELGEYDIAARIMPFCGEHGEEIILGVRVALSD